MLYHRLPSMQLPIGFFEHFCCMMRRLATNPTGKTTRRDSIIFVTNVLQLIIIAATGATQYLKASVHILRLYSFRNNPQRVTALLLLSYGHARNSEAVVGISNIK